MAVADLGVAVGPRNRRRLANGAVGLAVIAAIAATVVLLNRPSNHSGAGLSAGATRAPAPNVVTSKLVYGMSKKQVVHLVGQPTKIVAAAGSTG